MATTRARPRSRYGTADLAHLCRNIRRGARLNSACKALGLAPKKVKELMELDPVWERKVNAAMHETISKAEQALFRAASRPDAYGRLNERASMHYLTNAVPEDWRHRREDDLPVAPGAGAVNRAADLAPDKRDQLQRDAADLIKGRALAREPKRPDKEPLH